MLSPSALLRLPAALYGARPRCRPQVFHKSAVQKAASALCAFPVRAVQAARGLVGALSPGVACPLSSTDPVSVSAGASRVRVPSALRVPSPSPHPCRSGACALCLTATFPSPLPPASGGAGPVRSLRALLGTFPVPLFCERPAVCSGRSIFSLSFGLPQFKLAPHRSSLRLSSGHSGPDPSPSKAA